jgi:hypothetical protein
MPGGVGTDVDVDVDVAGGGDGLEGCSDGKVAVPAPEAAASALSDCATLRAIAMAPPVMSSALVYAPEPEVGLAPEPLLVARGEVNTGWGKVEADADDAKPVVIA